jgi:hypothetical protein
MALGGCAIRRHGAFNVSTAASVRAHAVMAERRLVWAPDATGSLAFLVSAVGAFVYKSGSTADEALASLGTFIGALYFLAAAVLVLPSRFRRLHQSVGT